MNFKPNHLYLLRTCFAPASHLLRTCFAPASHLLRTCYIYALSLILLFILSIQTTTAQNPSTLPNLNLRICTAISQFIAPIDKSQVPTGFLYEYGENHTKAAELTSIGTRAKHVYPMPAMRRLCPKYKYLKNKHLDRKKPSLKKYFYK
jgi:hypothetical protein